MKVIWVCNVPSESVYKRFTNSKSTSGSWITGMINSFKSIQNVDLIYLFPYSKKIDFFENNVRYLSFISNGTTIKYHKNLSKTFVDIFTDIKPDVIHIWGTEYPHTFSCIEAVKELNMIDNTLINIQGLCSAISKHFLSGLSTKEIYAITLRDFLKRSNIRKEQKLFEYRGKYEELAIKNAKNVIGRTQWDFACIKQINPEINYYYCGESLREPFYINVGKWNYELCEKHSIFVTQSCYPIKGFHLFLDGFKEIVKSFPDAKVYLTGNSPFDIPFYRVSYYQKLLREKIKKYDLRDNIIYLGQLNGEQMCEQMLKSNVFVSPSTIENSPNSVCEAMMLGTPVVASHVGGTMDLLKDKEEGYLYQHDAPYMMAHYVMELFNHPKEASEMGQRASVHALMTNNKKRNLEDLINIYEELLKK